MKLEGWIVQINGKYVACEDKKFLKGLMRLSGYTQIDDKKFMKITLTHPGPLVPDSEADDGFDPENILPLEKPDGSVSSDQLINDEPETKDTP